MEGGARRAVCVLHGVALQLRGGIARCSECEKLARGGRIIVAGCPHCGQTLLVRKPVGEDPLSVELMWHFADNRDGTDTHLLWVSAVRGSMALRSVPSIPEGAVIRLFCPICECDIPPAPMSHNFCRLCRAPVVELLAMHRLPGGTHGKRWVCTRRGCEGEHTWENGPPPDAQVAFDLMTGFSPGGC